MKYFNTWCLLKWKKAHCGEHDSKCPSWAPVQNGRAVRKAGNISFSGNKKQEDSRGALGQFQAQKCTPQKSVYFKMSQEQRVLRFTNFDSNKFVTELTEILSPVSCCCCWRASLLSRARCLFSSMRLRCSSVREGAAGAVGAGVEWTGPLRSSKLPLLNGSGSPKT